MRGFEKLNVAKKIHGLAANALASQENYFPVLIKITELKEEDGEKA